MRSAGEGEYAYQSVTGTGDTLPNSHTVTGLTAATSYQFRIRAHKETNGVSAHSDSNEITITTDDYRATVQTTASITVEDDASGNVERAGDRDWFAANLEAGTAYQFELHSGSSQGLGDPMIHGIHDGDGELLPNTSNDNATWFYWYSHVFFTAQTAGTYYVSAGASGEGVGTYVLSLETIEDDYAANTGTTGRVSAATPATGEVNSAHEEDWFRVTMDGTKNYQLELNGAPQGGGTLAEPEIVGVFDAQGALVPGTGSGAAVRTTLDFNPQGAGDYYISVGASGAGTGTYTLQLTESDRTDATELGDLATMSKAKFLDSQLDTDLTSDAYYKFTVSQTASLEFGIRQQERDADLLIEDADHSVIHQSRRDGHANEAIQAELQPGDYYVHVHAQEDGVNDYVLRYGPASDAALEPDTDATPAQARNVQFFNGTGRLSGNVDGVGDALDYVSFSLADTSTVNLTLTGHEKRTDLHRGHRHDPGERPRTGHGNQRVQRKPGREHRDHAQRRRLLRAPHRPRSRPEPLPPGRHRHRPAKAQHRRHVSLRGRRCGAVLPRDAGQHIHQDGHHPVGHRERECRREGHPRGRLPKERRVAHLRTRRN